MFINQISLKPARHFFARFSFIRSFCHLSCVWLKVNCDYEQPLTFNRHGRLNKVSLLSKQHFLKLSWRRQDTKLPFVCIKWSLLYELMVGYRLKRFWHVFKASKTTMPFRAKPWLAENKTTMSGSVLLVCKHAHWFSMFAHRYAQQSYVTQNLRPQIYRLSLRYIWFQRAK